MAGRHLGLLLEGGDGWRSRPVVLESSHRRRRLGLTPAPGPFDVLLRASSVHGFGLAGPIGWIALGSDGTVLRVGLLRARRLVWVAGARWFLEQPRGRRLPRVGERLHPGRVGP